MRRISVSILLLILTKCMLLAGPAYSQDDSIHLPFTLTDNGHIIVKATINGVEGTFIFDTGAGLNMMTKNFADSVGNLEKTYGFHTGHRATGEELRGNIWKVDQFAIGSYKLEGESFSVYDGDFPLDGLISLTPFKKVPITIDYENKMLIVESRESMKKRAEQAETILPIQLSMDQEKTLGISTYIHLDNTLKLQAKLDSGAGFDVYRFNARYMKPLGIDSTQTKHEYKKSYFKPEEGNDYYYTKVSEMSTVNDKIEVRNLEATFIDGLIYESIMSINWLGDQTTIDIPNKRLVLN